MDKWKDRGITALWVIGLLVSLVAILAIREAFNKREVLVFAFTNPELVLSMKIQFASESGELKKKFMSKELTPEQRLVEAVTEEVKGSKENFPSK